MENRIKNPLPKFELFKSLEVIKKVVHFVFDQMHFDTPNTGAAPMLDEQLSFDYDAQSRT